MAALALVARWATLSHAGETGRRGGARTGAGCAEHHAACSAARAHFPRAPFCLEILPGSQSTTINNPRSMTHTSGPGSAQRLKGMDIWNRCVPSGPKDKSESGPARFLEKKNYLSGSWSVMHLMSLDARTRLNPCFRKWSQTGWPCFPLCQAWLQSHPVRTACLSVGPLSCSLRHKQRSPAADGEWVAGAAACNWCLKWVHAAGKWVTHTPAGAQQQGRR